MPDTAPASEPTPTRDAFEAWVSSPPFERSVDRFPEHPGLYSWPGSYRDIDVDLAWQAWQAAVEASTPQSLSPDAPSTVNDSMARALAITSKIEAAAEDL
jgi:hypothetical protein